jgi:hypothetical protein
MEFKLYLVNDPENYHEVKTADTVGELMQAAVHHYGPGPWLVFMDEKQLELGGDERSLYKVPEFNLPDITDIRLVLKMPPPPPSSSIAPVRAPAPPDLGEVHAQVRPYPHPHAHRDAQLLRFGIKDPAASEYASKLAQVPSIYLVAAFIQCRQEGCDAAEMLQDLEEEDMLGWGFKKLHAKCIIRNARGESQSIRSSPPSKRNSSSSGSGEGAWESGRYRAVRKLGQGSFGQTWLVRDGKQSGLELALKEIQCDDLQLANTAIKESAFMLRLHHPQLVRLEAIAAWC